MSGVTWRWRVIAVALAADAGFVDAIGYLATRGYFASFMSGNTTRLGSALALDVSWTVSAGAGLIACFVGGVVLATLLVRRLPRYRRPAVVLLVSLLLLAAAGAARWSVWPAVMVAAAAMGAENIVFAAEGEVSVALTYVTGTLVKLGQRLASLLAGQDRWGWLPPFLQWAGLLSGAVAGALAYRRLALDGLWVAAAASGLLAGLAFLVDRGTGGEA